MNPAPLVSVVVPCYNYARFLPQCLDSILALEGDYPLEIIAVDDASDDSTQNILASYAGPHLKTVTHSRNLGHAATLDEALRLSRGQFVARIDPDDRYRPNFLTTTIPLFARHPNVALVYGKPALIDEAGTVTLDPADVPRQGRNPMGNELIPLLTRNFICAPTVIARREAWLEALPIPEGLAFNDWYLTLMIARRHDFYYSDEVLAEYRVHSSNHHSTIARNRTEEESVFRVLDMIYAETEERPDLEREKRRMRRHVYAAHHLDLAEKYFGFGMFADARRSYLTGLLTRPESVLAPRLARHLAGTLVGPSAYHAIRNHIRLRSEAAQ